MQITAVKFTSKNTKLSHLNETESMVQWLLKFSLF